MSWAEIKHAVNSTLGTSAFKSLDKIINDNQTKNDNFINSATSTLASILNNVTINNAASETGTLSQKLSSLLTNTKDIKNINTAHGKKSRLIAGTETWTVPDGVYMCLVTIYSATGGGGGAIGLSNSSTTLVRSAAYYGGGRKIVSGIMQVTPKQVITVTCGAAGAAGVNTIESTYTSMTNAAGTPGGNGGTSSFGNLSILGTEGGRGIVGKNDDSLFNKAGWTGKRAHMAYGIFDTSTDIFGTGVSYDDALEIDGFIPLFIHNNAPFFTLYGPMQTYDGPQNALAISRSKSVFVDGLVGSLSTIYNEPNEIIYDYLGENIGGRCGIVKTFESTIMNLQPTAGKCGKVIWAW